jgi:hypothetical protein
MGNTLGTLLQIIVIGGFILYAYSVIKNQSMGDTFREIKELIQSITNG